MGCGASAGSAYVQKSGTDVAGMPQHRMSQQNTPKAFKMIPDQYRSYEEVTAALRKAGLESCELIIGIDFTKSNTWTGSRTFNGRCLHDLDPLRPNPYKQVLGIIANSLKDFDDDNLIPAYGFGDKQTKDKQVFCFNDGDKPCDGLEGVLRRYEDVASSVQLSGPTSFAPLILHAIEVVRKSNAYHILLIIADGQVDQVEATSDAIVKASDYPLSIVTIGVGDGPWGLMKTFDDELPQRRFDNFQFVEWQPHYKPHAFACQALMEVPDQYQFIKQNGLLRSSMNRPALAVPKPALGPPSPPKDDLPPGWKMLTDPPSGKVYYWNVTTQETSWERPVHHASGTPTSYGSPSPSPVRRSSRSSSASDGRPSLSPASRSYSNLSEGQRNEKRRSVPADMQEQIQRMVNGTWKNISTRDRDGPVPTGLKVMTVQAIADDQMWHMYGTEKKRIRERRVACRPVHTLDDNLETGHVLTFLHTDSGLREHLELDLNEYYLWHGTSPEGANGISKDGFQMDLSGSHAGSMFGKGAYFAECASKADEYAHEGSGIYQGIYAMLLCRVCCGEMFRMLRSDRAKSDAAMKSGTYDAVLGDREASVGTYREFVVFRKEQIYPEFVVLYNRV